MTIACCVCFRKSTVQGVQKCVVLGAWWWVDKCSINVARRVSGQKSVTAGAKHQGLMEALAGRDRCNSPSFIFLLEQPEEEYKEHKSPGRSVLVGGSALSPSGKSDHTTQKERKKEEKKRRGIT